MPSASRRTTILARAASATSSAASTSTSGISGVTPEDRALNYAATNAFQARRVVEAATVQGLDLERITVHKSPICRPDSDCYDVEVTFFNPDNTNVASRVFRFTVDVSDVIPVTIGAVLQWTRRG